MITQTVIIGDDVLRAKLRGMSARAMSGGMEIAVQAGAEVLQSGIQAVTPVDKGELRDSIVIGGSGDIDAAGIIEKGVS